MILDNVEFNIIVVANKQLYAVYMYEFWLTRYVHYSLRLDTCYNHDYVTIDITCIVHVICLMNTVIITRSMTLND